MKKGILLMLIAIVSYTVEAQTLKDLLYSGKLKNDSGTVVRKGDDLSTKIDTTTKKKPVELPKPAVVTAGKDSSTSATAAATASPYQPDGGQTASTSAADNTGAAVNPAAGAPKDNNHIWKQFIDSSISTWKTELLPSNKIKSGTYYILVEYEIGTDGQIAINNVSCSPENAFLQQQVKSTLTLTAPQMNPVIFSNGKARKSEKKYNFTLVKK
jgi:hypothetical protein